MKHARGYANAEMSRATALNVSKLGPDCTAGRVNFRTAQDYRRTKGRRARGADTRWHFGAFAEGGISIEQRPCHTADTTKQGRRSRPASVLLECSTLLEGKMFGCRAHTAKRREHGRGERVSIHSISVPLNTPLDQFNATPRRMPSARQVLTLMNGRLALLEAAFGRISRGSWPGAGAMGLCVRANPPGGSAPVRFVRGYGRGWDKSQFPLPEPHAFVHGASAPGTVVKACGGGSALRATRPAGDGLSGDPPLAASKVTLNRSATRPRRRP
jgi:hypothetical protein